MYLTPDNAKDYVGMKLYADRSIFHYYPFTVFQYPDGTYATKDSAGVCSPVSNIPFNQVWFDRAEPQESEEDMNEVGVEIVKTEETEKCGIKYLNINVSNSEVERKPDIVRLCTDAGILEYVKTSGDVISRDFGDYPDEIPNQFDNLTGSMNI